MNNFAKVGMLTIALGAVFATADSHADIVAYGSAANAPARCQAFTPGVSNSFRNRVVGSENIGVPNAIACAFEAGISETSSNVIEVSMWFSNNGTSGPQTVNCSMLTGFQGQAGAILVNKTASVVAGEQTEIFYDATSTPSTTDVDLGFILVGVNCTVPTSVVVNDTYVYWADEDGVGS